MTGKPTLLCGIGLLLVMDTSAAISEETADIQQVRRPELNFTMAAPRANRVKDGPRFQALVRGYLAARSGGAKGFKAFVAENPTFSVYGGGKRKALDIASMALAIRSSYKSCDGPIPYDEGEDWVQFSWICNPSPSTPIGKLMSFQWSPEIINTVVFRDGKISQIFLNEVVPVPGRPLIRMDALATARADRK